MNNSQLTQLHPLEVRTLLFVVNKQSFTTQTLVSSLNMILGQANQSISWLNNKSLIQEVNRTLEIAYEITPLGIAWRETGIPVQRLLEYVSKSPCTLVEAMAALALDQKDGGTSFGLLAKNGNVSMDDQKRIIVKSDILPSEVIILHKLLQNSEELSESSLSKEESKILSQTAKKRGSSNAPFRRIEREIISYTLSTLGKEFAHNAQAMGLTGEELGAVSPDMIKYQTWKDKSFRKYNLSLPPNRVSIGRRNPYSEFLQQVKDKLVSLGFEEFDGPLVETEFWNSDALFMPQFHAARDIHDVYYVKNPTHAKSIEEPWLSQVAATHEHGGNSGSRGWNYTFDREFTRRLILRSQGTVMSAKTLPHAKVPGKYFGILRVFRHDQVDSTHLSDFFQTEGIILGNDVNLQTLLGLLKIFAEEFAHAEEVKYVPGYFPFTEPSIEVHIKHPQIGWMELGGSGIFRPEVTRSLGINVPVAAWGIGIDRMATMQMKINDLRDLFTNDLEKVTLRKGVKI